jgi:hypothetical protein
MFIKNSRGKILKKSTKDCRTLCKPLIPRQVFLSCHGNKIRTERQSADDFQCCVKVFFDMVYNVLRVSLGTDFGLLSCRGTPQLERGRAMDFASLPVFKFTRCYSLYFILSNIRHLIWFH